MNKNLKTLAMPTLMNTFSFSFLFFYVYVSSSSSSLSSSAAFWRSKTIKTSIYSVRGRRRLLAVGVRDAPRFRAARRTGFVDQHRLALQHLDLLRYMAPSRQLPVP